MEAEKTATLKTESALSIVRVYKVFRARMVFFISIVLIGAILGAMIGVFFTRVTYKATKDVILTTNILNIKDGKEETPSITNDISLAKIYLADVSHMVKQTFIIENANEIYKEKYNKEGKISGDGVSTSTTSGSIIFKVSYTDFSIEGAKEKLDCVIESARENISDYLVADVFDIKPIEYEATISENNKFFMCLGVGLGVGVALAILLILLIILFDNTVKDIDDIEEIVDANFMGYIESMNNK